jgi:hypothetical protein
MTEVKGHTGSVRFDGEFITIIRKGFLARAGVGKGEKRIPIASVAAVQWKPAGRLVNGYIEFSISGGNEGRSRFGSATTDAARNENAVIFTRKQMSGFAELRSEIEAAIADHHGGKSAGADKPSVAELINQLAELKKKGILTTEEYNIKKAELLRRM